MDNEKIVIERLVQGNCFLKTPDEVAELFGMSTSIRSKLKLVSSLVGKELEISDRSLDYLGNKGISKSKADLALEPLKKILEEDLNLNVDKLIPLGTRSSDLHIIWSANIDGVLNIWSTAELPTSCFLPLTNFFERRCSEYQPQREWIKRYRDLEPDECLCYLTDFYRPVIDKMLLDTEQIESVINILDKISRREEIKVSYCEAKDLALFSHDFNLSLFASLDLFARNLPALFQDGLEVLDRSFLIELMEVEGECYFGKFLSLIKTKTGCTYKKLALLIPIQHQNSGSGRTEAEAKVERLKEWRKGKTRPSVTVMVEFFSNFEVFEQLPLLIYGVICLSIDRMMKKYKSKSDRDLLKEIYSAEIYSRYYDKEKNSGHYSDRC